MTQKSFKKFYVLDTNVLLHDANSIIRFSDQSDNLIILPETVLDEIDSKKSGFDEINYQAREFARILEKATILGCDENGDHKIVKLFINSSYNIRIDIIVKKKYNTSLSDVPLNIYNDRKILEIAEDSKSIYKTKNLEFISMDIMARTRAISLNIPTNTMVGDKSEYTYGFHKEINIEENLSRKGIDNKDILIFDKDYKKENFSYTFKFNSGLQLFGYILNGKINLFEEEIFKGLSVKPLSVEQKFFTAGLLEDRYKILSVDAKAGSGKTLLALSAAFRLIDMKKYSRIYYIRNSIESVDKGEDIGYLPGLETKFAIYNHPLMDSVDFIARASFKGKKEEATEDMIKEKIESFMGKYNIEPMWVGEMRGRTLSDAFVIVDEAQNMSNKTMQMVLSRLDDTCKVIVVGSNAQIDNFYVNKFTNGLTTIMKASHFEHEEVQMFSCLLNKVYRGPITAWAERIFT